MKAVTNVLRSGQTLSESKAFLAIIGLFVINVLIFFSSFSYYFGLVAEILIHLIVTFVGLKAIQKYIASGGVVPQANYNNISGKIVVITGANTGIGKETAKNLALSGARVILCCRDKNKSLQAVKDIESVLASSKSTGSVEFLQLDLSSLKSVRDCCNTLMESTLSPDTPIDIVINNAGVMFCPYTLSQDQLELQLATNHLGHFLFTLLLLPRIQDRIINCSSAGHAVISEKLDWNSMFTVKPQDYNQVKSYSASKLANILFTNELQRRIHNKNNKSIACYSLHPGVVITELGRHHQNKMDSALYLLGGLFMVKNAEQGARTEVYLAKEQKAKLKAAAYYADCKQCLTSYNAEDTQDAKDLWEVSKTLVALSTSEVEAIKKMIDL